MDNENQTPAEEESNELSFDQIDSLLSFDPFNKDEAEASPPAEETPAKQEEAAAAVPAEGAEEQPPSQEAQPAEQAPQPQEDHEKVFLRQQLENMQKVLDTLQAPKQPTQQQPTEDDIPIPEYNFNIPEPLIQHLQSENPAEVQAGVRALAQGVAQTVHKQVVQQMASMVQSVVPQMVQQGVASANTAKEIFSDFYGTYKELNVPSLYPLVVDVAQKVASEYHAKSWSPQLRDETARRVKALLTQGQAPVTTPQVPQTPPAKPPAQFGGGGQRPAASQGSKTSEDIMKTLFGG